MNDYLYGSICLSDIPRELIRTAGNGKKYLSVIVSERKAPSQRGDTHYIKCYVKKDQQLPEGTNLYIGDLRGNNSQQNTVQAKPAPVPYATPSSETSIVDDLPF